MKLLVAISVVFFTACPSAICEYQQTRCADDVAQICDSQRRWQDVMDCSDVVPGEWECGEEDDIHTCIQP